MESSDRNNFLIKIISRMIGVCFEIMLDDSNCPCIFAINLISSFLQLTTWWPVG